MCDYMDCMDMSLCVEEKSAAHNEFERLSCTPQLAGRPFIAAYLGRGSRMAGRLGGSRKHYSRGSTQ